MALGGDGHRVFPWSRRRVGGRSDVLLEPSDSAESREGVSPRPAGSREGDEAPGERTVALGQPLLPVRVRLDGERKGAVVRRSESAQVRDGRRAAAERDLPPQVPLATSGAPVTGGPFYAPAGRGVR